MVTVVIKKNSLGGGGGGCGRWSWRRTRRHRKSAAVLREDMGVLGALLLAAMLPVVVSRLCSLPRRQPWLLA